MTQHTNSELNMSETGPVELSLEQLQAVAGGGTPKGGWGPLPVAPDAPAVPTEAPVPIPGTPKGGW